MGNLENEIGFDDLVAAADQDEHPTFVEDEGPATDLLITVYRTPTAPNQVGFHFTSAFLC